MSQYFNAFPLINYNNVDAINLTLRASVVDNFKQNITNFYPYTLKDNETATSLAYDYYGDPNYAWVIYYTNNIIDPYYDWFLNVNDFQNFIIQKYGSIAAASSQIVYYQQFPQQYYTNNITNQFVPASNPPSDLSNWTLTTIDNQLKISSVTSPNPAIWFPVYAYDDEHNKNEAKRNIILLNRVLIPSLDSQLKDILNG